MKRTLVHEAVEDARNGRKKTIICEMPSGWAVLCDWQYFRGYTILLSDPVVPNLDAMNKYSRIQFLYDMSVIGEAITEITQAYRINYEILGNAEPALHAHIIPRYASESQDMRCVPIWRYDEATRNSIPFDAERDAALIQQLAHKIAQKGKLWTN